MYTKIRQKRKNNKERNILPINEYLVDTTEDIQTLPTQISKPIYERCGAGSIAYCAQEQRYYILSNGGTWSFYRKRKSHKN